MRHKNVSATGVVSLLLFSTLPLLADKFADRVKESREVYEELVNAPDKGVPQQLLKECKCIVVIPHVIKAAFGFGGRHGKGIVSCRNNRGNWSPPAFMKLSGGSFGLQIGGQSSDLVLFLMSEKSSKALLKSKFTLGGDASVSAGPVGRTVEGNTDVTFRAEIYAYARSKGLFAGISLEGAKLGSDGTAIRKFYGSEIDPKVILFQHKVPKMPGEARKFVQALR
ncbi:MAG: lipid-binding SYLF domain-containing protein [Acidobacteriota bacterium]